MKKRDRDGTVGTIGPNLIRGSWIAVGFLCIVGSAVGADGPTGLDKLYLKSGAELQGKIHSETKENGRTYIVFKTNSGGLLKLERGKVVQRVHRADEIDHEYQRRRKEMPDTAEAHKQLYDWCQQQAGGKVRFKRELEFHLRRMVALDAHDEQARRLLGYELYDGQWVLKDQQFSGHGYVKQTGKWMPSKQVAIRANQKRSDDIIAERNSKYKLWKRSIGKLDPATLERQLFSFVDTAAVPLIVKEAVEEKNRDLRRMYVDALGRVESSQAQNALVYFAIVDDDDSVRERALTLLGQKHYDKSTTVGIMRTYLTKKDNRYVRRAGYSMGEIGTDAAIRPLIDGLVTTHKVSTGNQPGRMGAGFSNQGAQGMQIGGGPKAVDMAVNNAEVRNALRRITGKDFGFNRSLWMNWFVENHTVASVDLRRDE